MKHACMHGLERNTMTRWIVWAGLVCMTTLAVHAQWYFDVGPVCRGDMEISVRGGLRAVKTVEL